MVSILTMENSMWGVFHNQSALSANDTVDITLPILRVTKVYLVLFTLVFVVLSGQFSNHFLADLRKFALENKY